MNTHKTQIANSSYSVSLRELQAGPKHIQCDITRKLCDDIADSYEFDLALESVNLNIEVESHNMGVRIRGKLSVVGMVPCTTCLEDVPLNLSIPLDLFMESAEGAVDHGEEEITDDELNKEYYKGDEVVLDALICDSVLLELPFAPKCIKKCRKIGYLVTAEELEKREKPVDPRLAALANIKISKEN